LARAKISEAILSYLENEDLLDFAYALQITREELDSASAEEVAEELSSVIRDLLVSNAIIVGDYKGPNEIAPWSGNPQGVLSRLDSIIQSDPLAKTQFFWMGLPKHLYKGH
jgi:hypothetical protein